MISYVPGVCFYAILYLISVPKLLLKIHLDPRFCFLLVPLFETRFVLPETYASILILELTSKQDLFSFELASI